MKTLLAKIEQEPACLLVDPASSDPEGSAWDILATALEFNTRADDYAKHTHIDLDNNVFIGTDDVEIDIHSFDVWSDIDEGMVELDLYCSVFIEGDDESWQVTLESPEDIPLLERLLKDRNIAIHISLDRSICQWENSEVMREKAVIEEELEGLLLVLSGFEQTDICGNWTDLPMLPHGWGLLHVLRDWVSLGKFDYTQVSCLLWMIKWRSQEVWHAVQLQDQDFTDALKAGLLSVLDDEFAGFRGSQGHTSPNFSRWKSELKELKTELVWLYPRENTVEP